MSEKILQYDCKMIQDLLPLYQDDVCSDSSKRVVEEHLNECEECKEVAEKLKNVVYDEELSKERKSILDTFARKEKRRSTVVGMITAGILMIPVIVCLICNLAIGYKLDWFFVVLASLLVVASVTVVPLLVYDNVIMWTFGSFVLSLTILLGVICIYTHGNWFALAVVPIITGLSFLFMPYIIKKVPLPKALNNQKALITMIWDTLCVFAIIITCGFYVTNSNYWEIALPITGFSMILPWLIFICIRYFKINSYTKSGIILLIIGAFSAFVNDVVDVVLGQYKKLNLLEADFMHWNEKTNNGNVAWIILATTVVAGVIFIILGISRKSNSKEI